LMLWRCWIGSTMQDELVPIFGLLNSVFCFLPSNLWQKVKNPIIVSNVLFAHVSRKSGWLYAGGGRPARTQSVK
jgi:hypothetical protein